MLKHVLTLGKLLFTGIFSFLFFLVLLFVLQGNWQDGRGPELFGWTSYTILSNSMQPTFSAGDVVIMKPVEQPVKQDIVTFMTPSQQFFTHRVVHSYEENDTTYYTTKGDNNSIEDKDPIVYEQIVGKHVLTIPKLGLIGDFIKQPIGYGLFIVVPIVGFFLLSGYELIQNKRREAS